jgi:hypothetical protein
MSKDGELLELAAKRQTLLIADNIIAGLTESNKELRAALVEAVDALEVVCKYDREERDQPYEAGELALTRCKEVLK